MTKSKDPAAPPIWHEKATPDFWDQKHPKNTVIYSGRRLANGKKFEMEVANFFDRDNPVLWEHAVDIGLNPADSVDELAFVGHRHVADSMQYVSDRQTSLVPEWWQTWWETRETLMGDCEDGAIYLANLLHAVFPPDERWRVRLTAGLVLADPVTAATGGHGYVDFCRESDNEWVPLDWCYYSKHTTPIVDRKPKNERDQYRDEWFSADHRYMWCYDDRFTVQGRVRGDSWKVL